MKKLFFSLILTSLTLVLGIGSGLAISPPQGTAAGGAAGGAPVAGYYYVSTADGTLTNEIVPADDVIAILAADDNAAIKVLLGYYTATGDLDTDLQSLATPTAWRMFYSDDADPFIREIALGAAGTLFIGKGATVAPSWLTAGNVGDFFIAAGASDPVWAAHATLTSLEGLIIADVSILEGTTADTLGVVTSGGNNYILGSNAANTALEFKTPANVLTQMGAQPLDTDLTTLSAPGTWKVIYYNGSQAATALALSAANKFIMSNGASSAPTFESVTDALLVTTDVTTNDVTTAKHGFRPKLTNVAYSYLDETKTIRAAVTMPAAPGVNKETFWDHSATAFAYIDIEEPVSWTIHDSDSDTAIANGKQAWTVPATIKGHAATTWVLIDVIVGVHTKGITNTLDVQLRRRRAGSDVDMLSTKVTVGDEWYANDEVVNTGNDDLATGDQIYIDLDAVHTGTAAKGCSVTAVFKMTG